MVATETMHDVPTSPDEKIGNEASRESTIHHIARETKRVAVWGILIFAVVTALTAVTAIFWIIPAAILVVNVVLFGVSAIIEGMTRRPGDPHDETAEEQQARQAADSAAVESEESRRVAKRELVADAVSSHTAKIVAGILAGLTVLALLLAGILLQPELMLIGGMILVAYMLLVAAPAWLGWLNDEAEEVEHEVERDAKAGGRS